MHTVTRLGAALAALALATPPAAAQAPGASTVIITRAGTHPSQNGPAVWLTGTVTDAQYRGNRNDEEQ
jgi:hypothetical protein